MAIRHLHDIFTIDDHSYICPPYFVNGSLTSIHVGKYTSIAQGCIIDCGFGHDYKNVSTFPFHTLKEVTPNLYSKGNIEIGSDCWIGNAVTLMSGITIGNGSVIGAGTVVRRDVEPYEIYIGGDYTSPFMGNHTMYHGRKKFRFSPEIIEKLLALAWWDWTEERVLTNAELLVDKDINKFLNEHI